MAIVWEAPPVSAPGRKVDPELREAIETLLAHPGQWARIHNADSRNGANAYRSRFGRALSDTEKIELAVRVSEDKFAVYARATAAV